MAAPIVGENSIGIRLAWRLPRGDQALRILKHLSIGCARFAASFWTASRR
jgi:hypothetical protein